MLAPRSVDRGRAAFFLAALALTLGACASAPGRSCSGGAQLRVQDSLYFGSARPSGVVSAEEWAAFLRSTVTPRFAQGFSVWPASGQWRGAQGEIVREATHVLTLVHPGDEVSEQAVREIVSSYKSQFQQEAVLRASALACVSF